jgi:hypothetical protein
MVGLTPDWLRVFEHLQQVKRSQRSLTNEDFITVRNELGVSVFAVKQARWLIETTDEINNAEDLIAVKEILHKMARKVARLI